MNVSPRSRVQVGSHFLRRDGRSFVPVGAHYVPPSGPDWPWRTGPHEFSTAFAAMAEAGLTTVRIDLLWAAIEPEPGTLDETHLRVLDEIFDAASAHGISIHPTLFVGGEVGDAFWDVPWADGRNPHADPELVDLQVDHARRLADRWHEHPALIAWDLTDEPPYWIHRSTTTDADARTWTGALRAAIRESAPDQLVTIGTASQEVDHGPFRADVVAADVDFCCVHPYPIYSPELYPDSLLASRMTHAAAFETALASGAGRPVMVHEFGASTLQFAADRIADYDRLSVWSSFGAGAVGYYAWCWSDAEPEARSRAPYVRMPHELEFGLTTATGAPRPRLDVLTELSQVLQGIDLDACAGFGPTRTAAIPVPHEYVAPYDPAAFGLDGPAGVYVPAERAWQPERDVTPLVRAWLNGFLLAAGASMGVGFPRESVAGDAPSTRLLLVPAPLTTTTSSLLHVRTSSWRSYAAVHDTGGTVYLSLSADSAVPDLDVLAGVSIADRAPVTSQVRLRFVAPFGDLQPGDVVAVPAPSADLHLRGVRLDVQDAEVLAVDESGSPVLTRALRSGGATVVCAHPIELLLGAQPDATAAHELARIYGGLADLAGARLPARALDPRLTSGMLTGSQGGLLVLTNHAATPVESRFVLPQDVRSVIPLRIRGSMVDVEARQVRLDPYGAAALRWSTVT